MPPLRILHVMRAPVGGLFRHVVDLSRSQAAMGHQVGVIADSSTGAAAAEAALADLEPQLALGLFRVPMSRHLGPRDVLACRAVATAARRHAVDVLHGHGAKGGAYARLAGGPAIKVYTPHGGSLHYSRRSPVGLLYLSLERLLMPRTDLFLFESAFGRNSFRARIGRPAGIVKVVHNGVAPSEFIPVVPAADATDLVYVGELRLLKGVDLLLEALRLLAARGRRVSATIVGDGPDAARFRTLAAAHGLAEAVRFAGALPARTGFAQGRILVVPSRAESLPYVVLEAAAARIPIIATGVGGIPEIFGEDATALVPPADPQTLAAAIAAGLADPGLMRRRSERLQARVKASFSLETMAAGVVAAYAEARAARGP